MSVSPVSGGATCELIQIGARTTRSTDLSIVTAQGDTVTISASATHGVGYAAATGSSDGTTVTARALSVTDSSSLAISVDGDLNRRELHDIKKVVRALERAAARGDASRLLDRLSHAHLSSLSSVSGSITTETVVTANKVQAAQQPASSTTPAAPSSPDIPVSADAPSPAPSTAPATAPATASTDASAAPPPASIPVTTLPTPAILKTSPTVVPAQQGPRRSQIEDFMFAILKALLNPNGGTPGPVAEAASSDAPAVPEVKAA